MPEPVPAAPATPRATPRKVTSAPPTVHPDVTGRSGFVNPPALASGMSAAADVIARKRTHQENGRAVKRTYVSAVATTMVGLLSLSLTACGSDNPTGAGSTTSDGAATSLSGTLNGGGSSAQSKAQDAWRAGFQTANSAVTVNYNTADSGAGRKGFLSGSYQFAGSDSALDTTEVDGTTEVAQAKTRCNGGDGLDLPVYISPIAVAFNISGVKNLKLTPDTVAKIFTGKITSWNDPAILADNADQKDALTKAGKITTVHRSDDSGTTKNFSDFLGQAAPSVWTSKASSTWPLSLGQSGNGTSGVVQVLNAAQGTIGYADASGIGSLGTVLLKSGSDFVGPTADAAAKTVSLSKVDTTGRSANDIAIKINRTPNDPSAYANILVSYMIVCSTYADASDASLVKSYATYVTSDAGQQAAAQAAGSAPLPSSLTSQLTTAINSITSK